jgi:hypothetical protein
MKIKKIDETKLSQFHNFIIKNNSCNLRNNNKISLISLCEIIFGIVFDKIITIWEDSGVAESIRDNKRRGVIERPEERVGLFSRFTV